MSEKEIVYSQDEEVFNYDNKHEVIGAALADMDVHTIGDFVSFYSGTKDPKSVPSDFVSENDVDSLFESWNERACDVAGEFASDYCWFVPKDVKDELETLLMAFANKHFHKDINFYGVSNTKLEMVEITPELLEEHGYSVDE